MLYKTPGIVFRFVRFKESSIIVTIFTSEFGLQSYIVNSVFATRSKVAIFQPLTQLDLVVYHTDHGTIQRLKEYKCRYMYQSINRDSRKASIAFFLTEILNKSIHEQSKSQAMFEFLCDTFIELDQQKEAYENFHLYFLIRLSYHLGFGIHDSKEINVGGTLSNEEEKVFEKMLNETTPIKMSYEMRSTILSLLLNFYRTHIENFGEVRALQVVRELLL